MVEGQPLGILEAVDQANRRQKKVLFQRAVTHYEGLESLRGKRFAVWGLSFKPRTDDMREAPSIDLIKALTHCRSDQSMPMIQKRWWSLKRCFLPKSLAATYSYLDQHMSCVKEADALFIVTEWRLFHRPDFQALKSQLKAPVIFDGRNLYEPRELKDLGVYLLCDWARRLGLLGDLSCPSSL